MKIKMKRIYTVFSAVLAAVFLTACEGEKELNIIDGDLPIKTSTLYMMGDATPAGWSADNPTAFTASEEDALVFTWEGTLNTGELKLCLTKGSFDVSFIRPETDQTAISKTAINGQKFVMWAGDPDNKWRVTDAGKYRLTFDLRHWTMSTEFLGEPDAPDTTPIETDVLYMIGDATPGGWSLDDAASFTKNGYIFTWTGELKTGNLKACIEKDFNAPFLRPSTAGVQISSAGVAASDFVYTTSPDDQWTVTEAGQYTITFDLEHYTIKVEYLGKPEGGDEPDGKDPIETDVLYMIGDATPGGWSLDDAASFTKDPENKYIFTWTGELKAGEMKACIEKDFNAPFLRPSTADVEISSAGVAASDFVFTVSPDDKWKVTEAGTYTITFDLEHYTISVLKINQ